ncbi:MAG: hypothetical protein JGK28_30935 [Microcoleus sp. PH2017_07_MST_O_A]|nr:hypothetical protein [Microcoleus sp. PH2017_07_MST_O_A]
MKFSTFWGTILTASIFLVVAKPVVAAVLKNNEPVVGAVRATSPIYRFTNFWESSNPVQQLRGEEHLFGANTGEKVLFDFRAEVRGFNPVFAIFDSSNRQVGFSQYPYFTFLPASSGYYKVIVMSKGCGLQQFLRLRQHSRRICLQQFLVSRQHSRLICRRPMGWVLTLQVF